MRYDYNIITYLGNWETSSAGDWVVDVEGGCAALLGPGCDADMEFSIASRVLSFHWKITNWKMDII